MNPLQEIWRGMINDAAQELSDNAKSAMGAIADQAEHAAERAAHLQQFVGDPGYSEAVQAELDTLLLRAGIAVAEQGDAFDETLSRIVTSALNGLGRMARALA